MINNDSLKYFIHEELFLLKEEVKVKEKTQESVSINKSQTETVLPDPVKTSTSAETSIKTINQEDQLLAEPTEIVKKHVGLIVMLPKPQSDRDKEMLQKLIPAVNQSYQETVFIYDDNLDLYTYKFLIIFGETKKQELKSISTLNEAQQIENSLVIKTTPIENMHEDKKAKGLFWLGLKKMFKIP